MKTKSTKLWFAIALLIGALLLLFLYFFLRPVPSYAGKDANYWFDHIRSLYPTSSDPYWVESVQAFRNMGPEAAPVLVNKLERADSWERWYANRWASSPHWVQKSLPAPVGWEGRRDRALSLIAELGPSAKGSVPELIRIYSKIHQRSKNKVATATIGGTLRTPIFSFYADEAVCASLLKILGSAGNDDPKVLDVLIQALGDPNMSSTATRALVELAQKNQLVILRLSAELSSTNSVARQGSASAVRSIGPAAKEVVARLKERVTIESDKRIQFLVADALWKIDRQAYAVIPFRMEELQVRDDSMRWNAAACLGEYGAQSEPAIGALIQLLKDPNNRVRGIAAIALGKIGPAAKEAVPALTGALRDEYTNVQEAATEALKKIQQAETR